jgi:hypothetical protein
MRIPAWRVALTGGAIIVLAVAGIGFAAASGAPATKATTTSLANAATTDTATTDPNLEVALAADVELNDRLAPNDAGKLQRLLRLGRHLVHAEVTVTDKDGNLVNLQLDHGTVQSIGGGSLVIAEAGGGTETVSTSDLTKVHVGREKGDLGDLTVGAEVFVQSRIEGGTVLAKRIIVIPAGA